MLPQNDLIIHYTELGILLFLALSLAGLILLALVKYIIDRYFGGLNKEKIRWQPIITKLYDGEVARDEPLPHTQREVIGAAMAIAEFSAETPSQYQRLCRIIQQLNIDETLATAYRNSHMKYRKAFFLSLLSDLPCSQQRALYVSIIRKEKSRRLRNQAIYALSKATHDVEEAREFFEILSETGPVIHLSRNYCELLIYIIFKHLETVELQMTIDWILTASIDRRIIHCVTESLGRFRRPEMKKFILQIYHADPKDSELVAAVIRALFMSRSHDCRVVRESCKRPELPIRINCAKFGLDLCPPPEEILGDLIIYFFDDNHYVRQNIYKACQRNHIKKETILSCVKDKMPEKTSDRFFREMMEIYDTIEGTPA